MPTMRFTSPGLPSAVPEPERSTHHQSHMVVAAAQVAQAEYETVET